MPALSCRAWHLTTLIAAGSFLACSQGGSTPESSAPAPAAQIAAAAEVMEPAKAPVIVSGQLDLSGSAAQQPAVFRREGGAYVAAQGSYRALVGPAAATVTPTRDGRGPALGGADGAPLVIRTKVVERAGKRVDQEPMGLAQEADGTVSVRRGAVTERFGALQEGLEQQWLFAAAPAGSGDLVVRVEVTGQSYAGETEAGHHFADAENGLGLRYGTATWIDGSGRRTAVRPQWDAGAIVLRVPGEVVDSSTWPAVLDPVISTEIALDAPASGTSSETQVAVAFGGGYYLTVWSDTRNDAGDLYAVRVNANTGAVVDSPAINLTPVGGTQDQPAVAFSGTSFLVVYRDSANAGDIMGVLVALDGAKGTPFVITNNNTAQSMPSVAWDSGNNTYLVAWVDDRYNGTKPDIVAQRVTAAGSLTGGVIDLAKVAGVQSAPAVASNGTDFLVVWTSGVGTAADIVGQRVAGATGALAGGVIAVASGTGEQSFPDVAWGGSNFLVVWEQDATAIMAGRVSSSGAVLDPGGFVVSDAAGEQRLPAVVNDGSEFVVVWQDGRNSSATGLDIYGTRVSYSGTTLDPQGVVVSAAAAAEYAPAVASAGGRKTLVTYTSGTASSRSKARSLQFAAPPGATCTLGSQCESGFCADGVCCNSACGGSVATDCQACNVVGFEGECKAAPSTHVCRGAAGDCDQAESCDGVTLTCPANLLQPQGTVCRAVAGDCDVAEVCSGQSAACPLDAKAPNKAPCADDGNACTVDQCNNTGTCTHTPGNQGAVCRAAAGACDAEEVCDGTATCPADGLKAQGTVCRVAADLCDAAESCTGSSADCPTDQKQPSGSVCRAAAGDCDLPESCSGSSNACPTDLYKASNTVCRAVAGDCDVAEICSGTGPACPVDSFKASTVVCRSSAGVCDVAESCTGSAAACPSDGFQANTVVCRAAAGTCDAPETCTGSGAVCPADVKQPNTYECRPAAGDCDQAENCPGNNNNCPADVFKSNTTVCRATAGACDLAETCPGNAAACPSDAKRPGTYVCRPVAGDCDLAENCTGTADECPTDGFKSDTTVCRGAAGVCDVAESCTGSAPACPTDLKQPNTFSCRAAVGVCDAEELCAGTANACPADGYKPAGSVCRDAAGVCDAVEVCAGNAVTCPNDAKRPSSYVCRGSAGDCDLAENCSGSANDCPTDAFKADTVVCRVSAGACDLAESCTGSGAACPSDAKQPSTFVCRDAAGECDAEEKCTGTTDACPTNSYQPNGTACTSDNNPCTLDQCQGGACSHAPGNAGAECRAAAGLCDAPELCSGSSSTCPTDSKRPNSYACRPAASECDVAENCTGGNDCPPDAFKLDTTPCATDNNVCTVDACKFGQCTHDPGNAGTVCRPAAANNDCDVEEKCTGTTPDCPADGSKPNNTACTADTNPCTLDVCMSGTCSHPAGNPGAVCRAAAGACDLEETCTGSSTSCPTDARRPNSFVCRPKNGDCDVEEKCSGGVDCPVEGYAAATVQCRDPSCASGTAILAAKCPGNAPTCPAVLSQLCTPYVCSGTACAAACTSTATCAAGNYCENNVCKPKKVNGAACTTGESCTSTHCVDGYCCNVACAGQCEACDATPGTCAPVTGQPHGNRTMCGSDGTACGGSCNGTLVTACTYPGNTVQCRAAACANGVATIAAFCVNTGSCPAIQTQACAPFQCSGTQCGGDCVVDSNCATGSYCFGGICKLKADPGVACSAANQCKSGYCVDSVCCNSPCSGQCQACNEPNKLGTCSAVTGAPKGGRPACATDGTACGGTCNGVLTATCAYPSVQCRAPACSNDVATLAASCDGMGACPPMQTQACVPFKCSGTNCGGNCVLDSDCSGGSFCAAGVCLGKLPLGFGCGEDSHCLSGYCVDGVCCGGGCVGQCEACDNPGQQGTCLPVIGAPHGARPQCTNDGSVCSGTCNGSLTTGCAYPGAQSQCRAPACTNNVATIAAYCAGNGMCPAMQTQVCAPFLCEGTQCGGDCTIDSECASGHYCSAGVCKLMKEIGQPCGQPNECNSGYCADGYCCNEACSGQCEACDTQNALGVCAVVLGAPHGGKSACAGAGTCQGQCDGIDATTCAFPGMTVECSAASCQNSVQKSSANCDGVGSCQPAVTQSCGNFGCDGTVCKTECASPSDCKEGLVCVATQCVVPEGGLDAGADAVIDAQPDTQPLADAKPDTQDAAAGPDSPTDAADEQAVADDAAVAPVPVSEDAGGCGCSTPGSRTGAGGLAGVMLAAALAALRRRRTRRAA